MFATASSSKLTLSNSTPLTTIELELVKSQFSLSTESIPQSHPPYSYSSKEYHHILHRRGIRPPYAPDDPVYIRVNKDSHKVYQYRFDRAFPRSRSSPTEEVYYEAMFTPVGDHEGPSLFHIPAPCG
ncbi:hypothetical protein BU17DRAFT_94307 [Hysterangium stoloniferum]|nr:hypothetical protein BU17DRAFT_94307 [Hysterangium stoloniferum]